MLKENLKVFLSMYNIPLDQWGKGVAKTLDHLCSELSERESILVEENGRLIRVAEGGNLDVYYNDGGNILYLVEEKQVFKDGREKVREVVSSIGEKLKSGEDPRVGALRALSEELGIHEELLLIPKKVVSKGPLPSPSFPGIYTKYRIHVFEVFILPHLYKPEGYAEHQADKSSYFVWTKI